MREDFINYLKCPICEGKSFQVVIQQQDPTEIREGYVFCNNCQYKFKISKGVLDLLISLSPVVKKQQDGTIKLDLLQWGLPFKVEDADKYTKQILSLPAGDGSDVFKRETYFRNVAESAPAFYRGLSLLGLSGREKLLDLGAGMCWSTNKLAEIGCRCVALDISHHLPTSDIYIHENNVYFERIVADMDNLPFVDQSFDIVVSMTSIHHTTNLRRTFKEIARVLTPSGRVILINEPVRGIFEPKEFGIEIGKKLNLNDQWYTSWEYYSAAKKVGLSLTFEPYLSPKIHVIQIKRIIKSFLIKHFWVARLFTMIPMPKFPFGVIMIAQKHSDK